MAVDAERLGGAGELEIGQGGRGGQKGRLDY